MSVVLETYTENPRMYPVRLLALSASYEIIIYIINYMKVSTITYKSYTIEFFLQKTSMDVIINIISIHLDFHLKWTSSFAKMLSNKSVFILMQSSPILSTKTFYK